ncbi:MAG: HNH endonuclease [Chloroflexota bacterium]|nr:HNH endonuclease [Chloroflexota bacterium]
MGGTPTPETSVPFCQGPDWTSRRSIKEPGTCGTCGKPLVGRNKWFCRSTPSTYYDPGKSCRARYAVNHFWSEARAECLRRAGGRCSRCGEEVKSERLREGLEVHHRVPRDGGGYGPGCHHHQDNLEALCHQGHLDVTAAQRGYGQEPTPEERRMERLKKRQARYVAPWPGSLEINLHPHGGGRNILEAARGKQAPD